MGVTQSPRFHPTGTTRLREKATGNGDQPAWPEPEEQNPLLHWGSVQASREWALRRTAKALGSVGYRLATGWGLTSVVRLLRTARKTGNGMAAQLGNTRRSLTT